MPSFHYYAASWYTAKAHTHTHLSVLSHPLPPPPFGVGRRIMSAIFSIITLVAKILFRACAAAAAAEVGEEEGKKRVFRTIADQFPGERDEEGEGLFAGAQSSYVPRATASAEEASLLPSANLASEIIIYCTCRLAPMP